VINNAEIFGEKKDIEKNDFISNQDLLVSGSILNVQRGLRFNFSKKDTQRNEPRDRESLIFHLRLIPPLKNILSSNAQVLQ
jgi:hypothetical protein